MNREEALEQLYHLRLDWEEQGLYCKLNQTDINAIGIIVSELDKANNKIEKIEETTEKENEVFVHDYSCITPNNLEAKLWNNHGTEFMDEILSIIRGE